MANKAWISFLTDRLINTLIHYLRKLEKFVLLGLFLEVCQTCVQRALMGSGGSKQAGTGLWIAKGLSVVVFHRFNYFL